MVVPKVLFLYCFIAVCNCEEPGNVGIYGGHKINIERVPFMASLRINNTIGMTHHCGGSIINERYILSAAHCIKPNRTYKVKVGTDRINKGGKLYDVEKIIVHKSFSYITLNFDVCLIKLARDLVFDKNVAPIKLADLTVKLPKNTMLNVTGWGQTEVNLYSRYLQLVTVPLVTLKQCQLRYRAHRFKITHQMICAGKEGKDSCRGDSGGPLTKDDVQVGITSFGNRCGRKDPAVYVKVSSVLPWITREMKRNN